MKALLTSNAITRTLRAGPRALKRGESDQAARVTAAARTGTAKIGVADNAGQVVAQSRASSVKSSNSRGSIFLRAADSFTKTGLGAEAARTQARATSTHRKLFAVSELGRLYYRGTSTGASFAPPPPAGISYVYNSNEGTAGTTRLVRGPMFYESAHTVGEVVLEAFDGAHGDVNQSNRVGRFTPSLDGSATGVLDEVFPSNGGANGVGGYDNRIYTGWKTSDGALSGLFVPNTGFYQLGASNSPAGAAWTYFTVTKQSPPMPGMSTTVNIPPTSRPVMHTASTSEAALIYVPSADLPGYEEHINMYNVHVAYSEQLDVGVIIGGAQAGGPVDKWRLTIYVKRNLIPGLTTNTRYYAINRSTNQAGATVGGKTWMMHMGRAGCCFLGQYVYWCGGSDQGIERPYLFRADMLPFVTAPDPRNVPFTVENLPDAPFSFAQGGLTADPYSNTLFLECRQGIAIFDTVNRVWKNITNDAATSEFRSAFGGGPPFIQYPHMGFVDARSGTPLRKTYWWGGSNDEAISVGSTSAPGYAAKFDKVRSIKVTRNAENWATRSTGSGVLWAHDFSESDAEVELFTFTGGQTGTNVDPATIPNVIKRQSGIGPGGGYALRTKLVGATFTSATPSGVAGNSHTFALSSVVDFPDPAVVGPYDVFIGDPSDKDVQPYEAVRVTARNVGASTLTVTRRINAIDYPRPVLGVTYPYPQAASFPAGWSIGMNQGGEWRRPLVPFPAGSNGKAAADAGVTNGAKRSGANYQWSTGRNSGNHYFFRRGYYGSRYYWDTSLNASAKWATTWNASDFTANAAQGNIFEGDEFYLQWRMKVSANMMTQHESKFFYLHNAVTGGHAQIWGQVGRNKQGEVPLAAEVIPGVTYGHMITLFCQGGDGRAVDGNGYMLSDRLSSGFGGTTRWQSDYPASGSNPTAGSFCWPGDTWVTFLLHVKFGRDNAENLPVDTSSFNIHAPYPADTNPSYQTTVEFFVHLPGWADYKKLIGNYNYPWWFGDGISDTNYFPYNPAGLNAIWLSPFSNLYQNTGGEPPHTSTILIDYAQAICSKKPIAPPSD